MQRHPWVLHIPIRGLPTLPNEVAWFEEGLRCLQETGLEENEKASAILLVSGYVRNGAMIDADIEAAVRASGKTPDEWMASYAQTTHHAGRSAALPGPDQVHRRRGV